MRVRRCLAVVAVVLLALAAARATEFTKGPCLQAVTTASVTVMWEVDDPGQAAVEYGVTRQLGQSVAVTEEGGLRKARIEGLTPGRTYYYAVTDGKAKSATCAFRTLPESGPFVFAAYGDSRTGVRDHARVVEKMAKYDPLFTLHVGDFVWDGRQADEWGPQFFEPAAALLRKSPVFAVAGNHEYESKLFYRYLGAASGKPWYSFDCANAHFVMLDSCLPLEPASEQYQWLAADLSATDKRWRFAVFHYPLYSSGKYRSDVALRRAIEPVLQKYDVDVVFVGHDHDYERTRPIVSAFGKVHPIIHVVTGGGGAWGRGVAGDFFSATALSTLDFCIVKIDGDTLDFAAYNGGGQRIDWFTIRKSGDGYADGYPGDTAPMEQAAVEGGVEEALAPREIAAATAARTDKVRFEFTAPSWSGLTLDLEWHNPFFGTKVSPAKAHIEIPAGATAALPADLRVAAKGRSVPTVSVTGKTSLGRFSFTAAPFKFAKAG